MIRWLAILLISFFLGLPQLANAQLTKRDSLLLVWRDLSRNDTARFIALNQILSGNLFSQQPDSSIYYAHEQYRLGLELGNKKWQYLGLRKQADLMIKVGRLEEALVASRQGLSLEEELGAQKYMADSYKRIAYILRKQGYTSESLATYKIGLDHLRAVGLDSTRRMAAMLNSLGSLYINIGNDEQAEAHYERSQELYTSLGYQQGVASTLINRSNLARNLKAFDRSLNYLNKARGTVEKSGDNERLATVFHGLGSTYLGLEDYEQAKLYFLKSLAHRERLGLTGDLASSYGALGRTANLINQPKEANAYCQKALAFAQQASNVKDIALACLCLYDANKQLNRDSKALAFFEKYTVYRDSLVGAEATRKLTLQQAAYDYDKERLVEQARFDQERSTLAANAAREQMLRNIFIGLVIFLGLILGLAYRTNRLVQRKNTLLAEQNKTITTQRNELSRLGEMKTRFFTNISHELRTPLTMVLLPIDQLLTNATDQLSASALKSLRVAKRNTERLRQLVEDILDLASMESIGENPEPVTVNIKQLLEETVETIRPAAEAQKLTLKLDFATLPTYPVALAAGSFRKIMDNLLSNALKYTPGGGWIEIVSQVDIQPEGQFLLVTVLDSGEGIAPADIPHVFDRFFQTNDPTKELKGGNGIGLALVQELTKNMGGEVTVRNEAIGGACFSLRLPLGVVGNQLVAATPAEEARPQVQKPLLAATAAVPKGDGIKEQGESNLPVFPITSGGRILIVEDNTDMRNLLEELLSPTYRCTGVADGQEALEAIGSEAPAFDLVLSDVMMPNMDGYELLRELKRSAATASIPVIMLTARVAERDRLQALRLGVDDYLAKPFSTEELSLRIQHLLGRAKNRTTITPQDNLESIDQIWLENLETLARDALQKQLPLNADYLARNSHISTRTLQRRLKAVVGFTTKQYILEIKLSHARTLLENKQLRTVAEVAHASGFSTPAYFSRIFEERFGHRPISYLKN